MKTVEAGPVTLTAGSATGQGLQSYGGDLRLGLVARDTPVSTISLASLPAVGVLLGLRG